MSPSSKDQWTPSSTSNHDLDAHLRARQEELDLETASMHSVASASSYSSSVRERTRDEVAAHYFGPTSSPLPRGPDDVDESNDAVAMEDSQGNHTHFHADKDKTVGQTAARVAKSILPWGRSESDLNKLSVKNNPQLRHDRWSDVPRYSPRGASGVEDEESKGESNEEAELRRAQRKENERQFRELAHFANTRQPVPLDRFKRTPSRMSSQKSLSSHPSSFAVLSEPSADVEVENQGPAPTESSTIEEGEEGPDRELNTELIQAYIEYSRKIGHEPCIEVDGWTSTNENEFSLERASLIGDRPQLKAPQHFWTKCLGERYSRKRGRIQFCMYFVLGLIITTVFVLYLNNLSVNAVLHLDAFTDENVVLTTDYAYLHIRDEVSFHLKYDIESQIIETEDGQIDPASYFQVLLMTEDQFEDYVEGEEYTYLDHSRLRTTKAHLPDTYIYYFDEFDEVYIIIQPCILYGDYSVDFCQGQRMPREMDDGTDLFNLQRPENVNNATIGFNISSYYVNPQPEDCASTVDRGGNYLLIFVPYVLMIVFGLRLPQMLFHCEGFRANLERHYRREFGVPENEVDAWQPMPWDRKVPRIRLLGPCCWRKMRKPTEPFDTWWRHENYFTWIFSPYRNERLSRSERALIIACTLYVTFYVAFVLYMLHGTSDFFAFSSIVLFYVLLMLLPAAGKAIFKELFKLIFRQRRKFYRIRAAGGDTGNFSFRWAFAGQLLVVLLLTIAQLPMFYIWLFRSCMFLKQFMYFAMLAAVMRSSLLGLLQDFGWYMIIKTWGWKDLCPYCTERLLHCDCFNDELLILSVARVGANWELIKVLESVLSKQEGYVPQFEEYTAEQLKERWQILVDRAEKHVEKLAKLAAYREKKRRDRYRRQRQRRSFMHAASTVLGMESVDKSEEETKESSVEMNEDLCCSVRERKILALQEKIQEGKFEKHYDSNIVDVFNSIKEALMKRRQGKAWPIPGPSETQAGDSDEGTSMWVYDTPDQRLERRELEKKEREKMFKVLKEYKFESVVPEQDEQGRIHYRVPSSNNHQSGDGPTSNDAGEETPLPRTRSMKEIFSRSRSKSRDTPLLPGDERQDDVVVVVDDDDLETLARHPTSTNVHSTRSSAESPRPLARSRTYAVTEHRLGLIRRASGLARQWATRALGSEE